MQIKEKNKYDQWAINLLFALFMLFALFILSAVYGWWTVKDRVDDTMDFVAKQNF